MTSLFSVGPTAAELDIKMEHGLSFWHSLIL